MLTKKSATFCSQATACMNPLKEVPQQGNTSVQCSECLDEQNHCWLLKSYRPRGSLARALYDRQIADSYINSFDKSKWYQCDLQQIPKDIAEKFVQLEADKDTWHFLQKAEEKSEWIVVQIWHSLAKTFLGLFMTQTSINGWLRRGSMFVLSLAQFLKLMDADETWRKQFLLDLGAGDGEVTSCLASPFEKVFVTEVSPTMQTLLERKGFTLLDHYWHTAAKYDVISCLNLLDRCDKPQELLAQMRDAITPDGRVLVALVLPFSPYVETGSPDHRPAEMLPIKGRTFEQQVTSAIEDVFLPAGFEVTKWARVPYLCEGDLRQSYYWLDDAVFVLKPI